MDQGIIIVILALSLVQTLANPDAKRLYDDLLADYNRLIRCQCFEKTFSLLR